MGAVERPASRRSILYSVISSSSAHCCTLGGRGGRGEGGGEGGERREEKESGGEGGGERRGERGGGREWGWMRGGRGERGMLRGCVGVVGDEVMRVCWCDAGVL